MKTTTLLLGAAIFIAFPAAPAGPDLPLILRDVTMAGTTGPAFYSVVERGYRFVTRGVPGGEEIASLAAADQPVSGSAREP